MLEWSRRNFIHRKSIRCDLNNDDWGINTVKREFQLRFSSWRRVQLCGFCFIVEVRFESQNFSENREKLMQIHQSSFESSFYSWRSETINFCLYKNRDTINQDSTCKNQSRKKGRKFILYLNTEKFLMLGKSSIISKTEYTEKLYSFFSTYFLRVNFDFENIFFTHVCANIIHPRKFSIN